MPTAASTAPHHFPAAPMLYRPVSGPLPGGALAAVTLTRGALVMLLDAGAHPSAAVIEAAALEAALAHSARR